MLVSEEREEEKVLCPGEKYVVRAGIIITTPEEHKMHGSTKCNLIFPAYYTASCPKNEYSKYWFEFILLF